MSGWLSLNPWGKGKEGEAEKMEETEPLMTDDGPKLTPEEVCVCACMCMNVRM